MKSFRSLHTLMNYLDKVTRVHVHAHAQKSILTYNKHRFLIQHQSNSNPLPPPQLQGQPTFEINNHKFTIHTAPSVTYPVPSTEIAQEVADQINSIQRKKR